MEDYADGVHVHAAKPQYEQLLSSVQVKKQFLDEQLTNIEKKAQICKDCKHQCDTIIQNYQPLIDAQAETRNGTDQTVTQTARELIQSAVDILQTERDEFQRMRKKLECFCITTLYQDFRDLISLLVEEVKHWQHELQLRYAELYAKVDLHSFAPSCAKTGELLRDVLGKDIPRLENAVNAASVQVDENLTQLVVLFRSLLTSFYQRTFVVVSQECSAKHDPWNVKKGTGTASTPVVTLRILGADTLEAMGGKPVYACFVNESHINSYYDVNTELLDTNGLEEKGFAIKGEKMTKFVHKKTSDVHEACFNLDVYIPVNLKRVKDKRVYGEKYRLVFYTVLNDIKYWTLSLPMVVTTGGIQLCECLGSIMWQCFSTDVFVLPTEPLPELHWSRIAEMLQAKIRDISTRKLTESDLDHLKHRLLSAAGTSEVTEINLNQFCSGSLPNLEFSFWKWFLSIYNLIKKDLKDVWKKGLIEGFLSKETTAKKLKSVKNHKQGLFLLRFSDGSLDSTQTKDSVFGKVATSVLVKSKKGNMTVTHVDLIGHDELSKDGLLQILSKTKNNKGKKIYKYLYPNMENCEKLLEGIVIKPAPVVIGYIGAQNAKIVDLEKIDDQLSKLDLGENKTTCPTSSVETDSDADDDSETVSPCVSEAKKLKTSLNSSSVSVCEVQDKDNGPCEPDVFTAANNRFAQLETLKSAKDTPVLRQMLTNPMPEKHSNLHVYETQLKRNIDNSQITENIGVDITSPSAQMNVANATNFLQNIKSIDSEDNITNIGTGSGAAAKPSGSSTLDTVIQNQSVLGQRTNVSQKGTQLNESNLLFLPDITNKSNAIEEKQMPHSIKISQIDSSTPIQGQCIRTDKPDTEINLSYLTETGISDSNLKTAEYMITSTRQGQLSDNGQFDVMQLAAAKAFDNDAVLGSYYGDKNVFDKQVSGLGLVDSIAVSSSKLFKPNINANQQAHNKVPTIKPNSDCQNFDAFGIDQNEMKIAHGNNSDQILDLKTAPYQISVADDMSEDDLNAYESIEQLFNGDFDDFLNSSNILGTICSPSNVPMQTETSPESINVTMEQSEALQSDDKFNENVKSYLEYLPREKLLEILPKNLIMELIPLFLTKMECLTPLLERLPKDMKQRVIQALQNEKKN